MLLPSEAGSIDDGLYCSTWAASILLFTCLICYTTERCPMSGGAELLFSRHTVTSATSHRAFVKRLRPVVHHTAVTLFTASVCLCHMCWGRDSEKPGLSSTQSKHGVDTAVDLDWFTDRHVSCFSVYMWYIIVHLYISGYCTNRVLTNFYSTIILTTMA